MAEMTNGIQRLSPVSFEGVPADVEDRNGWKVILKYNNEGDGPYLVDLSHKPRWDAQDGRLDALQPGGMTIPPSPGQCGFKDGLLVNRMNRTQAAVWQLKRTSSIMPAEPAYTDVTESTVFLSLFGRHTFGIAEKLSALDFSGTENKIPFLLQGPFSHVPCQVVTLEKHKGDTGGGILLTCSRGYARSMVHAILNAGREFDVRPAGEQTFLDWFNAVKNSLH